MGLQATADEPATLEQDATLEADMLEGFAEESPESTPTVTLAKDAGDSATPDAQEPATTEAAPTDLEANAEEPVNELTSALQRIASLEERIKKSSDDMYGRLGFVEQVLKAQAKTPAGKQVRLKKEHFGNFADEYPEFAEATMQSVNKVLEDLEITGLSQDFVSGLIKDSQTAAETVAEKRYAYARSESCREDLDETHPGWRDTIGLPDKDVADGGTVPDTEYRRWLATQPKEYADRVLNSYSPVVIGRSLDKFAESKKKPSMPSTPKPQTSTRQQQLRAAVTPRAAGAPPKSSKALSTEEAMMAAFEGK